MAPVTEKTTSSLPELGSQSNTTHEASSSPQSFHMSSEHSLGVSDTPPSSTLPISAAAITTPLVAVGSSLQSVSSSSNLPLSAAAITTPLIAGPPRPEQSSSSSTNRFVISVAEEKSTTPSSPPASVVDGLPNYSSSSIRPNLACPSETDGEDASESGPKATDAAAIQACNPNGTAITGDFSSTTNSSSTPNVPERAKINPAKGGTYLESSATQDQQSHCLDVAAHQYQACWEILNVTGYLQDWVSFNQDVCDEKDMGFADCFLYLEVGDGTNCTSFTGRSQCPSPSTRTFASRTNGQQAYYVAFNIWNIQNWFFTYYLAVSGANGLTADNINNIARTLNLPEPKKFPILDLLAGLAFGFGLISPAGYAAVIPKLGRKTEGFAAQAPGEYLLRAVQNAPTLGRNLMATGDLGNSDVQIAQLGSSLARIVAQLQNNIQNSIILVMSNFSLFLDFVQDGFFSTQISNLNTLTQNVTLSLNTYIVSQSLQMDKVIITRAVDTDINELQLNGSATMYDTNCGHGYDEWGMCANWWYDSTNHISYGLESQKNMLNNYTDALESLFNQGITTPELLFLNSQLCADAAGSTQGNAPGTSLSTSTGIWNTECISNMKICTWETVVLDVTREYTDCDHESAFAMEGCGQGLDLQQWVVPASYIGAYLTQYLVGVVCNSWGKGMGSPNG